MSSIFNDELFSAQEKNDLLARKLPSPTCKTTVQDLDGAVLFGAGRFTRALIKYLEATPYRPAWIVDNNRALHGTYLSGLEIRSSESLREVKDRRVVIMSDYFKSMSEECLQNQVKNWSWCSDLTEVFGDLQWVADAEWVFRQVDLYKCARLFANDPKSLAVFKSALAVRITGDLNDLPEFTANQYFVPEYVADSFYQNFLDCGAFTGDTLDAWLQYLQKRGIKGCNYYAIEPDPDNFKQLSMLANKVDQQSAGKLNIFQLAVGSESGVLSLVQGGAGSTLYAGLNSAQKVQVKTIDSIIEAGSVGCIKMDLEGFELEALKGAIKTIKNQRPVLMIAAYHRVEHLWQIPLWISSLNLNYKIRLLHHDKSASETICYAIP